MDPGYVSESPRGYAQSGAGALDAAALMSSLAFGPAGVVGIPQQTVLLIIQPQAQAIRWRDDGGVPTAAVGYPVAVGVEWRYTGNAFGMQNLRIIGQAAGAIINVVAYAQGGVP